jgi:hypothetical protein
MVAGKNSFHGTFSPLNLTDTVYPIIIPDRVCSRAINEEWLKKYLGIAWWSPTIEKEPIAQEQNDSDYNEMIAPFYFARTVPVIFTQNDIIWKMWVNGTKGSIFNYGYDYNQNPFIEVETDEGSIISCNPPNQYLSRPGYNRKKQKIENENIAIVRQFPLQLAFSMTIHKAQGLTLDKMAINKGPGFFSAGQAYVALSRVRSIDNLTLHVKIEASDIMVSRDIREFFDIFVKYCKEVNDY